MYLDTLVFQESWLFAVSVVFFGATIVLERQTFKRTKDPTKPCADQREILLFFTVTIFCCSCFCIVSVLS